MRERECRRAPLLQAPGTLSLHWTRLGPLAQSAEQWAFNPWVQGSIPWRPTKAEIRAPSPRIDDAGSPTRQRRGRDGPRRPHAPDRLPWRQPLRPILSTVTTDSPQTTRGTAGAATSVATAHRAAPLL